MNSDRGKDSSFHCATGMWWEDGEWKAMCWSCKKVFSPKYKPMDPEDIPDNVAISHYCRESAECNP